MTGKGTPPKDAAAIRLALTFGLNMSAFAGLTNGNKLPNGRNENPGIAGKLFVATD